MNETPFKWYFRKESDSISGVGERSPCCLIVRFDNFTRTFPRVISEAIDRFGNFSGSNITLHGGFACRTGGVTELPRDKSLSKKLCIHLLKRHSSDSIFFGSLADQEFLTDTSQPGRRFVSLNNQCH